MGMIIDDVLECNYDHDNKQCQMTVPVGGLNG